MRRSILMGLFTAQLVWILLALLAINAGRTAAAAPRPLLNDCVFPCWLNIVPRGTLIDSADGMIQSLNYRLTSGDMSYRVMNYTDPTHERCDLSLNYSTGVVLMILLRNCPGVRVGDVLALFGTPDGITSDGQAISFQSGQVIAHIYTRECREHFSLRDPINIIYLLNPGTIPQRRRITDYGDPVRTTLFAWRGLLTRAQYHAFDSDYPLCAV